MFYNDIETKESIIHSNDLVPYSYYHCIIPDHLPDVTLHWHNEIEIDFVLEGGADYQVGERHYHAKENDIIITAPNILHSVYPHTNVRLISDTLIFRIEYLYSALQDNATLRFLKPLLTGDSSITPYLTSFHDGYHEIRTCLIQCFEYIKNKPNYFELGLRSELIKLFYLLSTYGYIKSKNNSNSYDAKLNRIKDAITFIQNNYDHEITIDDLAEQCFLSKSYFMSFFKDTVGMTPNQYIQQFRLKNACILLKDTNTPIAEIATRCGYSNLSNFNRQFKSYLKITPKEFRKQN